MKNVVIGLSIVLAVSLIFNIVNLFGDSEGESIEQPVNQSNDVRASRADRTGLDRVIQHQNISELEAVRKLAVDEGAEKTTALIDKFVADREKRTQEVLEKMKQRRAASGLESGEDIEKLREERRAQIKERYLKLQQEREKLDTTPSEE